MGGSSTQSNNPYKPAQPYIDQQLASNYNLYNSQQPQYYRAQYQQQALDPSQQAAYDAAAGKASGLQNRVAMLQKMQSRVNKMSPGAGSRMDSLIADRQAKLGIANQALGGFDTQNQRVYNSDAVAGPNAISQEATDALLARARAGSPIQRGMESGVAATLNGDYMNPASNPWLSQTYDTMAGKIGNNVQQQMMMAGREGSGANQTMLTDQLGQLANSIYGQNYQNERANQMALYGQAPGLAQSGYNDINQIAGVGRGMQNYQQQLIDADKAAFDYQQNLPFQQAANYSNLLNGGIGQYSSGKTTNNPGVLDYITAIGSLL